MSNEASDRFSHHVGLLRQSALRAQVCRLDPRSVTGRTNPGGHGWTKDVSPPSAMTRPKGLPPRKEVIHMESPDQSQDSGQEPAQSQEQPQQDSGLQTPQPDQPVPTEPERQQTDDSQVSQPDAPEADTTAEPGPSGQPAEGTVGPSADQQASAAVQREQELEADRRARQERLGNEGEIREGEVQAQRQEHNQRTGGGDVPQA